MAESRMVLDDILRGVLDESDKSKLYFDPPDGIELSYPCIIYKFSNSEIFYADDKPYLCLDRYVVTVIDTDPDSELRDRVKLLKKTRLDRSFVSDHLYHYVFSIYI